MSRRRRKRDTRTDEEKVAAIVRAVADAGAGGIRRVGKETACRRLASMAQIPQPELHRLMPEVVAKSGELYPGKRVLVTAGRYPWYVVENTTASAHLHKIAGRAASSGTTFLRHVNELDVELAAQNQQTLRDEGRALYALLESYISRVRAFADASNN